MPDDLQLLTEPAGAATSSSSSSTSSKPAGAAKKAGAKKATASKPADEKPADELPAGGFGTAPKRGRGRPSLKGRLQELIGTITGAGLLFATMRGDAVLMYDAQHLANHAEQLATQLDKLAQQNPAVKRVLESLLKASDSAELITLVGVIVVPLLANHGIIPAGLAQLVGAPPVPERPAPSKTSAPADEHQADGAG